jgi:hypothetical protein
MIFNLRLLALVGAAIAVLAVAVPALSSSQQVTTASDAAVGGNVVSGASALVVFIRVLYTLRPKISPSICNFTYNSTCNFTCNFTSADVLSARR